jgi:protein-S-isoprenylcysteine O-methyltransferase Ste14
MNIWIGKATLLVGIAAVVIIRTPHGKKSTKIRVVKSERGWLEIAILTLAWLGSVILPVLWMATPLFSFAEYPLHPAIFSPGVILFSLGLWLFHRSHADLGTNWSVSLKILENHTLITTGVYKNSRHPMYMAIFLEAIGQALIAPNWLGRVNTTEEPR